MGTFKHLLFWTLGTLLLLQLIKIDVPPAPKATQVDEIKAPKEVMAILRTSCYDCHSNETKYPWYEKIAPISWQVDSNIKNGRNYLNFSIWNRYSEEEKQKRYKKTVDALNIKMPPAEYLLIHKDARLTPKQREIVKNWAKSYIKEEE